MRGATARVPCLASPGRPPPRRLQGAIYAAVRVPGTTRTRAHGRWRRPVCNLLPRGSISNKALYVRR
eukprot:7987459-Heterocapsa_arctica.AAC.1